MAHTETHWTALVNLLADNYQLSGNLLDVSDTYNSGSDSNVIAPSIYSTRAHKTGKYFFEIGYVTDSAWDGHDWSVYGGIRTQDWASYLRTPLGKDATGYAIRAPNEVIDDTIRTYHNDTEIIHSGSPHFAFFNSSFHMAGGSYRRGPTILVAIDYDEGKLWLGLGGSLNWDSYQTNLTRQFIGAGFSPVWAGNGDPAAGTDPTYTFTPGTAYCPAYRSNGGSVAILKTHPGTTLHVPPAGFSYYDQEDDYMALVRLASPYSYYLAFIHDAAVSNMSYLALDLRFWDFSGNLRPMSNFDGGQIALWTYGEPYTFRGLRNHVSRGLFARRAPFPSTATSVTFEGICYLQTDCRVGGSNNTWDEGTGIFHNQDIRLVMRGRRLIASVGSVAVTMSDDLTIGPHHFVMRVNTAALTLKLTVDNVLIGSVALAGVPNQGAYMMLGSLYTSNYSLIIGTRIIDAPTWETRLLTQHLALYDSELNDATIDAHWQAANDTYLVTNQRIVTRRSSLDISSRIQR